MKVLVTGIDGHLGGFLAEDLPKDAFEVVGFRRGDNLGEAVCGVDAVLHCAGRVPPAEEGQYFEDNIVLTRDLLSVLPLATPLWHSGTVAAEGVYGKSKMYAAQCIYHARDNGLKNTVVAKLPAVLGPGFYGGAVGRFCRKWLEGGMVSFPSETNCFIGVRRISALVRDFLRGEHSNNYSKKYHVRSPVTFLEMVGICRKYLGDAKDFKYSRSVKVVLKGGDGDGAYEITQFIKENADAWREDCCPR